MTELVRVENIRKTFGGVVALDGVTLSVQSGEILALVGENGAGKSTLMKILSGVYGSGTYEGAFYIDGSRREFSTPLEAEKAGVAIIHQELSSFPHLTVAENLFVGHWPRKGLGRIDWGKLHASAGEWLARVGADCRPTDRMADLPVGTAQLVEIAKALSQQSKFLILDEPTSALTPQEVENLFRLLRQLKGEGKGIIYISHKIDEIAQIADTIAILRDGKTVRTAPKKDLSENEIISLMVGRNLDQRFPPAPTRELGELLLRLKGFVGRNQYGKKIFGPLSLQVRRGEMIGIAGLLGAGRTEFIKALFGDPSTKTEGTVELHGKLSRIAHPRQGIRSHLAYVSEDRKMESIFPGRSLEENVSISRHVSTRMFYLLRRKKEKERTIRSLDDISTRYRALEQPIETLSGGNQQKVVIARALQLGPDVMMLDEPTRGVDVGAKYEIYEILYRLASEGKGLLVVSSELPELIGLCDRIHVLHEGEQAGSLEKNQFSQDEIMKLAVGRR